MALHISDDVDTKALTIDATNLEVRHGKSKAATVRVEKVDAQAAGARAWGRGRSARSAAARR